MIFSEVSELLRDTQFADNKKILFYTLYAADFHYMKEFHDIE